jgi:hypothetical protein
LHSQSAIALGTSQTRATINAKTSSFLRIDIPSSYEDCTTEKKGCEIFNRNTPVSVQINLRE